RSPLRGGEHRPPRLPPLPRSVGPGLAGRASARGYGAAARRQLHRLRDRGHERRRHPPLAAVDPARPVPALAQLRRPQPQLGAGAAPLRALSPPAAAGRGDRPLLRLQQPGPGAAPALTAGGPRRLLQLHRVLRADGEAASQPPQAEFRLPAAACPGAGAGARRHRGLELEEQISTAAELTIRHLAIWNVISQAMAARLTYVLQPL